MIAYFVPAIGLSLVFAAIITASKADALGRPRYNIIAIALLVIGLPLTCLVPEGIC